MSKATYNGTKIVGSEKPLMRSHTAPESSLSSGSQNSPVTTPISTATAEPSPSVTTTKPTKTFTGCWTCRSRKIRCDLRQPTCVKCENANMVCEGYSIKLRWSCGASSLSPSSYSRSENGEKVVKIVKAIDSQPNEDEEVFSRRSVSFVEYPPEMIFESYNDMDTTLAKLNAPTFKRENETIVLGPFGVFQGKIPNYKRTRKTARSVGIAKNVRTQSALSSPRDTINNIGNTSAFNTPQFTSASSTAASSPYNNHMDSLSLDSTISPPIKNGIVNLPNQMNALLSRNHSSDSLSSKLNIGFIGSKDIAPVMNTNSPIVDSITGLLNSDGDAVSSDLLNGSVVGESGSNTPSVNNTANQILNNFDMVTSLLDDDFNELFNPNEDFVSLTGFDFEKFHNEQFGNNQINEEQHIIQQFIQQHTNFDTSNTIKNDSGLSNGKNGDDKNDNLTTTLSNNGVSSKNYLVGMVDASTVSNIMTVIQGDPLDHYLDADKNNFSTNSLLFTSQARYILHHYIKNVTQLMTVVVYTKNPWTTIYLPRALNALGDLVTFGTTATARNALLHALLAVSAFNLQSKFPEGSDSRKFYLDIGIQLKKDAYKLLGKCLCEDINRQKYKDILTAIMSMVTIDIIWGTTIDCNIHLRATYDIIRDRTKKRPIMSPKAVTLHRIFFALKIMQESTSLDPSEMKSLPDEDDLLQYNHDGKYNSSNQNDAMVNQSLGFHTNRGAIDPSRSSFEQLEDLHREDINKRKRIKSDISERISKSGLSKDNGISVESPLESNNEVTNSYSTFLNTIGEQRGVLNGSNGDNPGNIPQPQTDSFISGSPSIVNSAFPKSKSLLFGEDQHLLSGDSRSRMTLKDLNTHELIDKYWDGHVVTKFLHEDPTINSLSISTAMYGIPDSLLVLFSRTCAIVRQSIYHNSKGMVPSGFTQHCSKLEHDLVYWDINIEESLTMKCFDSYTNKSVHYHTKAFHQALIIYYYRLVKDIHPTIIQDKVRNVLDSLVKMQAVNEKLGRVVAVPLMWPGFIAACEAISYELQEKFQDWLNTLTREGLGTYIGTRKVVYEVWKRKNRAGLINGDNIANSDVDNWWSVIKEWKVNLMLM